MLSTPLICCSMGVATDCSRVNASAPTYVAQSWTCGGAILGNCAIGSRTSAAVPTMTVRMAITMATTGRLTKNFAIIRCSLSALGATGRAGYRLRGGGLRRGRLRIHRHAGFDFLHAFNHDPLARLEPLRDDPHVPDLFANFHRADVYFMLGSYHRHLSAALQLLDRHLWHKHRPFPGLGRDPDLGVLTGTQNILGVGKQALHGNGASPQVDLAIGEAKRAPLGIHAAIGEGQHKRRPLAAPPLLYFADPPGKVQVLLFANGIVDLDWVDL